jgi:putative endonuclease
MLLDMDGHLALGRYGEELATRYLCDRGMQVLERNWRCPEGEIDIIALDGDCLVVCEVKTRAGTGAGDPLEAVTWEKARRLRRLAAAYLRSRPNPVARARIDVVGILAVPGRPPVVRHVVAVGA